MSPPEPKYKRVILKLSGEALGKREGEAIDPLALAFVFRQIKETNASGIELGIVCGGGNIVRGELFEEMGVDRVAADQMGMLATVINGMALREALEGGGLGVRLFSSLPVGPLAESYLPQAARETLAAGKIVIFAGGTGNPFVSTDTAALLRACDVHAQVVLKATKVDGIYSADPWADSSARKFDEISYDQALKLGLKIMDFSAIALAKENNIPVIVFNFWEEKALKRIVLGEKLGTLMHGGKQ